MTLSFWNRNIGNLKSLQDFQTTLENLYTDGEFDKTIVVCECGLKKYPRTPMLLFYKAQAYYFLKRLPEAMAVINSAIMAENDNACSYVLRGNIFDDMGDTVNAAINYDKAIQLDPEYPLPYLERALFFLRSGKTQDAIIDLDKCISLDADFQEAFRLRGECYNDIEEFKFAVADLEKAKSFGGADSDLYVELTYSKSSLGLPPAEILPDAVMGTNLNLINPEAWYRRGVVESELDDFEAAVNSFTRSLLLAEQACVYLERASALLELGRYREALEDAEKYLNEVPNDAGAKAIRGMANFNSGDFKNALPDLKDMIEECPDFADGHYYFAVALSSIGEIGQSVEEFGLAIILDPSNPGYRLSLGEILWESGDVEAAEREFSECLKTCEKEDFDIIKKSISQIKCE